MQFPFNKKIVDVNPYIMMIKRKIVRPSVLHWNFTKLAVFTDLAQKEWPAFLKKCKKCILIRNNHIQWPYLKPCLPPELLNQTIS